MGGIGGKNFFVSFFFFFCFLGLGLRRFDVPSLGPESELQPPAYTTVTAMPDLNHICDLHQSLWQCRILNTLSKASDQNHVLMDTSQVHYH